MMCCCVESAVSEVSRAVVDVDDEVTLTCSVKFGAPLRSSSHITSLQLPTLTMTFGDEQQTAAVQEYLEGQPGQTPHTITSVSVCLSLRPSFCFSVHPSVSQTILLFLSLYLSICQLDTPYSQCFCTFV